MGHRRERVAPFGADCSRLSGSISTSAPPLISGATLRCRCRSRASIRVETSPFFPAQSRIVLRGSADRPDPTAAAESALFTRDARRPTSLLPHRGVRPDSSSGNTDVIPRVNEQLAISVDVGEQIRICGDTDRRNIAERVDRMPHPRDPSKLITPKHPPSHLPDTTTLLPSARWKFQYETPRQDYDAGAARSHQPTF